MGEVWYKGVTYENAKELVKENLENTVAAFIASGYWLKYIRDSREYEKDGYQNFWDCAEKEFGLKISEASRAMSMNDKYSVAGNTPYMAESYKTYNKSQLQEMLTMSAEQMEQVTPDMTIKEIREIKNPKPLSAEENLEKFKSFIYDFVQINYMQLNHEFSEAAGVSIERLNEIFDGEITSHEFRWFILIGDEEAELVDKITGEIVAKCDSNTVITIIADKLAELRESKQFCDVAKAETDTVDTECEEEAFPESEEPLNMEFDTEELLKELDDAVDAEYREVAAPVEDEPDAREDETIMDESSDDLYKIKELLKQKNDELSQYLTCEGIPESTIFEKKTIVAALANMVCELEDEEENAIDSEQPKLPEFKNDEQRKVWIKAVEAWGLWYEDKNIQARYYKYDFPDGSRLIAVKYKYTCPPWLKNEAVFRELDGTYQHTHYHMIFSEEYKRKYRNEYDNYFVHATVSTGVLVEFIKEISKRGNRSE